MFGKERLEDIVSKHPDSFPAVKLLENFHHFIGLYNALDGKWEKGWGSYLFYGQEYKYESDMLKKQEELFRYSMKATNALEIGVYVGHSLLIMLLANPDLKITCIDNEDRFSRVAVEYLNANFNNRVTFILDDAVSAVNRLDAELFDLVHIDADHNDAAVKAQFNSSLRVAKLGAYYVFDDYIAVKNSINAFLGAGFLKHIVTPNCPYTNCVTQLKAKTIDDGIINICSPFSALGKERLQNNIDMMRYVDSNNVNGDVVEIGVYKGGSMLAFMLSAEKSRHYYLYDTFSGMTEPSQFDKDLNGFSATNLIDQDKNVLCISSLAEVKKNISVTKTDNQYIHYIEGDILKNTVYPELIAILRLDTDWYESTAFELANFYDKVVSGGVVIIDDYGHWLGCKKAVDEFLLIHPSLVLKTIDYTGVYFIKP